MASDESPVTLQLTGRQKATLTELIDHYEEGVKDAREATIEDHSLDKVEDLLELSGGYADSLADLQSIRTQLNGD